MSVWNPLAAPGLVLQAIGVPGPQVGGGGVASCASAFVSYMEGAGVGERGGVRCQAGREQYIRRAWVQMSPLVP